MQSMVTRNYKWIAIYTANLAVCNIVIDRDINAARNILIKNINDTCPPYEKFMTLIKYIQLTYFNSVGNEKYSMSENTMKQFNRFQI